MAIKKNPSGRSATITKTGVTGNAGDGRGTPRRSNPMAQSTPSVPKRMPTTLKPAKRQKRG